MSLALVSLMAIAAPQAVAPLPEGYEQIHVGDPRIDARRLRPYRGAWRIREQQPDGSFKEVERSSERVDIITRDGRRLWRQVQHETLGNSGVSGMTALTDYRSFAPLIAELRDDRDGSVKRLTYSGRDATLECGGHLCPATLTAPATGTTKRPMPLAEPGFDYWGGSYGLLFATLPLKVGAKLRVPVVHPVQGLIQLRVEVTGIEKVNAGGGRMVDAFRIVTPQTGWVYHVSKKAPYWLRLEYKMQSGAIQITERV
jgi:hypothetical protein